MFKKLLIGLIVFVLFIPSELLVVNAHAKGGYRPPAKATVARTARSAPKARRSVAQTPRYRARASSGRKARANVVAKGYRSGNSVKARGSRGIKTSTRVASRPRSALSRTARPNARYNRSTNFSSTRRVSLVQAGLRKSHWKYSPRTRGQKIEAHLAKTHYKGWYNVGNSRRGKFPLVDFQRGRTLVSLKTVDTRGKSWNKEMRAHIRDLGSRGATVSNRKARMVLDIRVKPGQVRAARHLIEYGKQHGVRVEVRPH